MTGVVPGRRWHLGFDDRVGLASTALATLYLVGVVLAVAAIVVCVRSRRRLADVDPGEARTQQVLARVWTVVAVVLVVLLTNRAFDLQTRLLDAVRRTAQRQGWYDRRKEYQFEVIAAMVVVGLVGIALLLRLLRRVPRRVRLVVVGVTALAVYSLLRAVSLHAVDHVLRLGSAIGPNAVIEVGLLCLVLVASVAWHRGERQIVGAALTSPAAPAPGSSPRAAGEPVTQR